MTDHNCRGCKHYSIADYSPPCSECKRMHRVDKYEAIPTSDGLIGSNIE